MLRALAPEGFQCGVILSGAPAFFSPPRFEPGGRAVEWTCCFDPHNNRPASSRVEAPGFSPAKSESEGMALALVGPCSNRAHRGSYQGTTLVVPYEGRNV